MPDMYIFLVTVSWGILDACFASVMVVPSLPDVRYNQIQVNASFRSVWGTSFHDCIVECGRRSTCESGNYFRHVKLCQLNTVLSQRKSFEERYGAVYFKLTDDMRKEVTTTACYETSCENGERCGIEDNDAVCQIKECPEYPLTSNHLSDRDGLNYIGARRQVRCQSSIENEPDTIAVSVCLPDGTWSPLPEPCPNITSALPTTAEPSKTSTVLQTPTTISTRSPMLSLPSRTSTASTSTPSKTTSTESPTSAAVTSRSSRSASFSRTSTVSVSTPSKATSTSSQTSATVTSRWSRSASYSRTSTVSISTPSEATSTSSQTSATVTSRSSRSSSSSITPNPLTSVHSTAASTASLTSRSLTSGSPTKTSTTATKSSTLSSTESITSEAPTVSTSTSIHSSSPSMQTMSDIKSTTGMTSILTTTNTPQSTSPFAVCEDGWTFFEGFCYRIHDSYASKWNHAMDLCESLGAQLTDVRGEADFLFLRDIFGSSNIAYWIGGKYLDSEGDGSAVGFTPPPGWYWYGNQGEEAAIQYFKWLDDPQASGGQCIILEKYKSEWFYVSILCEDYIPEDRALICKKESKTMDTTTKTTTTTEQQVAFSCDVDWMVLGDMCYRPMEAEIGSWQQAQERCNREGSDLVSLHNDDQFNFIVDLLDSSAISNSIDEDLPLSYWIGGKFSGDQWVWMRSSETDTVIDSFQWTLGTEQENHDAWLQLNNCLSLVNSEFLAWRYVSTPCDDVITRYLLCEKKAKPENEQTQVGISIQG